MLLMRLCSLHYRRLFGGWQYNLSLAGALWGCGVIGLGSSCTADSPPTQHATQLDQARFRWSKYGPLLLWAAILATMIAFWKWSRLASGLLVPYLAWVSFAVVLNFAIWWLNAA